MYYMYAGIMNGNGNGNDNGDKMAALCFFFCSILFVSVLFSYRFRCRVVFVGDLHKYVKCLMRIRLIRIES